MSSPRNDRGRPSLAELFSLEGRVAVVTGGGSGIGAACAARLAEAGARVVVGDLDRSAADAVASALESRGHAVRADMSDPDAVTALVAETRTVYGHVDIWVNAAGIYPTASLLELETAAWDEVLAVNLRGSFLGAREAARAMVQQGEGGVIINITSTAAYAVAGSGASHYVASKFGLRGLTKSLAVELGTHGIRVLAVAPTVTLTPGLERRRAELEANGFVLEGLGESLPLGRVAEPDDVARVVVFCASELAGLMTGTTLVVDAGELAG
jgi:NAD(P)-dependent dehydrogenase (short-subunit alcohol dehydrogenase family)